MASPAILLNMNVKPDSANESAAPAPSAPATPDHAFLRPNEGESDEDFADRMADWAIAALDADRAKRGLPPLGD